MPPRLFKPAARYPADPRAVFILSLCVMVGIPLLFGDTRPSSLEELLPTWLVIFWGFVLTVGAILSLVGMSRQSVNGAIIEQVGSATAGLASLFYAGAVLIVAGMGAIIPMAYVVGFGLASLWRWGQLQAWLTKATAVVQEQRDDRDPTTITITHGETS